MKNILLKENNVFSEGEFKAPPQEYAPTYNWVWNGELSHEETDRQIEEFKRLGIKSLCVIPEPKTFRPASMPSLLEPDYLTAAYFEEYKYAVEKVKESGMSFFLYDEGGWPSGGACGKVMNKHPEYAKRRLNVREISVRKGDTYKAGEYMLAAYVNNEMIQEGHLFDQDATVFEYFEHIDRFGKVAIPEIPDISRKDAVDCFIEMTHKSYEPYLKDLLGNTVLAVFSDEPHAPSPIPFREELEKKFLEENGYSIREFLPQLLGRGEMTQAAAKAKIAWIDMCSKILCENYFLNEKEWTNKHNMLYTGHVAGEHSPICTYAGCGFYHLLRVLRCFDIPGIDVIWRQIFPVYTPHGRDRTDFNNGFFPRYASSAAAQIGSRRALTESMGVYGAGVTFDEMRYVFNYQAVRGINLFNVFGVFYAREGFLMMGEMPIFTEKQACYKDLPTFNRFAERLAYLASLGERVADVGYYIPVNDLWVEGELCISANVCEKTGRLLEDENVLFDCVDDDVIKTASETAKSGKIMMGKACYSTIVIPACKYIPEETISTLNRFIEGGGKVVVISDQKIPGLEGAVLTDTVKNITPAVFDISGDIEKIRLGVRKAENGTLYLLFNESKEVKTFLINSPEQLFRLYPEHGRISRFEQREITLNSGEMLCLWCGEQLQADEEKSYKSVVELRDRISFRKTNRFIIGEMNFVSEDISESEYPFELGDWSEALGKDYSGSGIYKMTFTTPVMKGTVKLDLGEVHYVCEAFLNGKSLGVLAMSPFCYEIPAESLEEVNTLEIRVTNTAANEYYYTKSFDKWNAWQLSTYMPTQNIFHQDSLSGGLYGPIRLWY